MKKKIVNIDDLGAEDVKIYNEDEWIILTDGDLAKIVRVKEDDVKNKYISCYLVEYPNSEKHPSGIPQWKFYHSIDRLAETPDFKKHIIDDMGMRDEYGITKNCIPLDDLEEGKRYQVLIKPVLYRGFSTDVHSFALNEEDDIQIGLYEKEIDTIWKVEVKT